MRGARFRLQETMEEIGRKGGVSYFFLAEKERADWDLFVTPWCPDLLARWIDLIGVSIRTRL